MTSVASPDSLPARGKASVNILLVDDEGRNLDVLESILTAPDYRLVRAGAAQEALMALLDGEFAVIVLDIQMPGTNGIELAHIIKQRKRTQHIPIIFLTAYFQENKDIIQGYEVGAVDYLTKPVDSKILRSKVAVFVELFQKNQELALLNRAMQSEIRLREAAELALRQTNNELEARVQERATKLMQANDDLRLSNLAVRESEQRYRQLIKSLPAAVYTTDAEGFITLYNEAARMLWGREADIGKDLWCGSHKIFNPDGSELPPADCPMATTLKEGRPIRGQEIIIERPDGTRRNVLPYPDPIWDANGKIIGAVNMLLDITDIKRAEEVSRRLAAIVESSDDAILSRNLDGMIMSWNRGAEWLFGYAAAEIVGQSITTLMPPNCPSEEMNVLERIRNGERIEHYETVRRRKDGTLVEVSMTVSPLKDDQGNIVGISKIMRNIAGRKQAERELERAHKEAVAASRAKDDFLAALSHELRTPLNPVLLLASDAAENSLLTPEIRAQFATIRNNVELEARLIDDLLDITSISHGKLSLNMGRVDVHAAVTEALATIRTEMEHKKIELVLRLGEGDAWAGGDSVRLQQVFWNVLKNAVKFTAAGGTLTIESRFLEDNKKIEVKIMDTGIGMTAQELGHIFNAFSQGEHAAGGGSHRFGGLGLGLTISRMLVELHGGSIRAHSAGRDLGATFFVELPLIDAVKADPGAAGGAPAKRAAKPEAVDEGGKPPVKEPLALRILLVEDHEPTRIALSYLLKRRGCQVAVAPCVAEAQKLVREQTFDLVISDIGLPDGNGYALMAELRDSFGLKGIALSGYGMEADVVQGQKAGFVSHLTKPVRIEALEKILGQHKETLPVAGAN